MDLSIYFLLTLLISATVESRNSMTYSESGRPFRGGWLAVKVTENEVNEDSDSQVTIKGPLYNVHLLQGFPEQMFDKDADLQVAIQDAGYIDHHLQRFIEQVANREEGPSRIWKNLRFPFEWSHLSRKTLTQRHSSESNSGTFICDTCMHIATQAEQVVSDPDTMNRVIEIVNSSLCQLVLPGQHEECVSLVESYISQVFELLKENLNPEHLCVDTKLCARTTTSSQSDTLCRQYEKCAAEVLTQLNENNTETQVMSALHLTCSKMGIFRTKCHTLVDIYCSAIFLKSHSMNPREVCQELKLCNAFGKQKNYCATCEYVTLQMKAQLLNPVNQEMVIYALSKECTKVPSYVDKCKEIVSQYAPFVLANIDSLLDANTVCTLIHACQAIPTSSLNPAEEVKGSKETQVSSEGATQGFLIHLPSLSHEHAIQ